MATNAFASPTDAQNSDNDLGESLLVSAIRQEISEKGPYTLNHMRITLMRNPSLMRYFRPILENPDTFGTICDNLHDQGIFENVPYVTDKLLRLNPDYIMTKEQITRTTEDITACLGGQ